MALAIAPVVTSCSTGDGTDLDARTPALTVSPTVSVSTGGTLPAEPAVSPPTEPPSGESAPTFSVLGTVPAPVEVPETGVPGLDSDDAFCAAWSRFGGSFQVVAVNAAFGGGDATSIATLELVAAPTVDQAYRDLSAGWPADLEPERATALGDALGPFAVRVGGGEELLVELGATDDDLATIAAAWEAALAARDPQSPDVVVDLPDELWTLVEAAAARQVADRGDWRADESLVTKVETPLTDAYLATACPDQGTLAGQEIADG